MIASLSIVKLEVEPIQAALSLWMVVASFLTVKPHPDCILVTEPSVYNMRSYGLLFSSMRNFISDSVLPAGRSRQCFRKFVLPGASRRDAGIGFGIFPIPW